MATENYPNNYYVLHGNLTLHLFQPWLLCCLDTTKVLKACDHLHVITCMCTISISRKPTGS